MNRNELIERQNTNELLRRERSLIIEALESFKVGHSKDFHAPMDALILKMKNWEN